MIDDPELRSLFKAESEEHLQTLETGLLHLEAEPHDSAALEELFRSAHNLKGAAGMLGVESVETLAHHFEDQLGATRRGQLVMSSVLADRLYRGLDAMRRLAREASGGEPADVDLNAVLDQLRGESPSLEPVLEPAERQNVSTAEAERADERTLARRPVEASDESLEPVASTAFKIETIRVEPQRLDALMTLAGEMVVSATRVARALTVIDELIALSEEWGREANSGTRGESPLVSALKATMTPDSQKQTACLERFGVLLGALKRTNDAEVTRLSLVAGELEDSIRHLRLLPFSTLFNLFPRLVRDLSQEQEKAVRFVVEGGTVTSDKHLLEAMKDPLMHLIRNAIDHGIERPEVRESQGKPPLATLLLRASQAGANVVIEIADDGQGLDEDAIRRSALAKELRSEDDLAAMSLDEVRMLIFAPGFSTSAVITDLSGRGVGLDVVRSSIERLKGTITVESVPGRGCTFRLQAPMTLATTRVLLVQVAKRSYALPLEAVQEILSVELNSVFSLEGRPFVRLDSHPFPVAHLAELLELPPAPVPTRDRSASGQPGVPDQSLMPCILLAMGGVRLGLFVDALLDEQEVILKPFGGLLQRVRNVFGATILASGEICMVLNPQDLIRSAPKLQPQIREPAPVAEAKRKKVVLLADDSITTRTQEKRILESAGYEVVTAVDGADAFHKLATRAFDALVSDVEMPNMDGLALAARIRRDPKYTELPIILVTSLASDADRQRGVEVGANAYIPKGTFDQTVLLNTLRRLV
ncbi:MAG: CheA signal transduction histidine kinase [Chthonomonadales bacterium]|nr:CheA signal transduction histidine kinase [Chthonomonadales bacterium]